MTSSVLGVGDISRGRDSEQMKHLAQRMVMKTAEKDEAVGEEDSFRKASQTVAFELGPEGGAAGALGDLGTPVSGRG